MKTWLDTRAAAQHMGFAPKTLENWRAQTPRQGPDFRKVGRAVRYDAAELDRFIEMGDVAA